MSAPTGHVAPTPEAAWPNDTYSVPQKNLSFNGEAVEIFHQPANTDGNSFVLFRHSDVAFHVGDLFDPTEYPIIDLKKWRQPSGECSRRGTESPEARSLFPADHQEGGTMIIPGHGRLSDAADLDAYQQMVTIVRDRIRAMIKDGTGDDRTG